MDFQVRQLGPDDVDAFRAMRLEALTRAPDAFSAGLAEEAALPADVLAARLGSSAVYCVSVYGEAVGMPGCGGCRTARCVIAAISGACMYAPTGMAAVPPTR